jgi:outer membrane lipoprotein-sorting protein
MKSIYLPCLLAISCILATANAAKGGQESPTVDSVLEKYVKASGGKSALEKVTSRMIKGKLENQMIPSGAEWRFYAKAPDKQRVEVEIPGLGTSEDGFDGQVAWSKSAVGLRSKTGDELAKTKRDSQFMRELHFKTIFPNLIYKGVEKVDSEDANVLEFKAAGDSKETFFFSKNSGLLLRQDSEFSTGQGKVVSKAAFSDYRQVDGINYPHAIKGSINAGGQDLEFTLKITEIQQNVKLEDSKFSKPGA